MINNPAGYLTGGGGVRATGEPADASNASVPQRHDKDFRSGGCRSSGMTVNEQELQKLKST